MPPVTWVDETFRRCVIKILQKLPMLPRHVGIVMDGNRRYALKHHRTLAEGHNTGFGTMSQILGVAYNVGVKEVTVYAFSIENFNRTPKEVDDLMNIARTRLKELIANEGLANEYKVRIKIIGKLELLPDDLQELASEVMEVTKNNDKAILNLCMPYTSREDITQSIRKNTNKIVQQNTKTENSNPDSIANRVEATQKAMKKVTPTDITDRMYTAESYPLDLLVRTSGTFRLSDFLLWEINRSTFIDFVPELWPEYSPFCFLKSILRWYLHTNN